MNWPVSKFGKKVTEEMEHCTHLKVGEVAYRVDAEYDSFGPLDFFAMCKECAEEQDRLAGEEEVTCDDCKGEFKKKDTIEWRWYDFYAAQGDEPVCLCIACSKAQKHLDRVAKDRYERDLELGEVEESSDEDDYYEDDYLDND